MMIEDDVYVNHSTQRDECGQPVAVGALPVKEQEWAEIWWSRAESNR
jgi:hypothetical protein